MCVCVLWGDSYPAPTRSLLFLSSVRAARNPRARNQQAPAHATHTPLSTVANMRLTPISFTSLYYINNVRPKNGRRPARRPFAFTDVLPMFLRDHVSGKNDRQQNVACLQEMSILFACMKKNEFTQAFCSKEIESFQSCHKEFMHSQRMKNAQERQGLLVPGEKNLSHKQLNVLLKKYPQPK
nr:coiled-coil-helix-coiled-coil-helix domain-containing protein 1-like [Procambarus clarkii]